VGGQVAGQNFNKVYLIGTQKKLEQGVFDRHTERT